MKHKEYIIPIGEEAKDYDEMFIAVIRKWPELIRCKDCKYLPGKGRAYADDDPVETYIHCGHLGENGYCSFAKRDDDGTERS